MSAPAIASLVMELVTMLFLAAGGARNEHPSMKWR